MRGVGCGEWSVYYIQGSKNEDIENTLGASERARGAGE